MGRTLYDKVYDAHVVYELEGELPLLYIDRHLVHNQDCYSLRCDS